MQKDCLTGSNVEYEGWVSAISTRMNDSSFENAWFWIIDGCAHPDFQRFMQSPDAPSTAWTIYMNTYHEEARRAGPWFIRHQVGHGFSEWVFENLQNCPMGILIKALPSDESLLFEHFQQLFECTMPNGQLGAFRYYDPRLLYGVSTSGNKKMFNTVCGPALSIYAWDPGRGRLVHFERSSKEYTLCSEPQRLDDEFLAHLWQEVQCYTIISTLGGEAGEELRKLPLQESYKIVSHTQSLMRRTHYTNNVDVAMAVLYTFQNDNNQRHLADIIHKILTGEYSSDLNFEDIISIELGDGSAVEVNLQR